VCATCGGKVKSTGKPDWRYRERGRKWEDGLDFGEGDESIVGRKLREKRNQGSKKRNSHPDQTRKTVNEDLSGKWGGTPFATQRKRDPPTERGMRLKGANRGGGRKDPLVSLEGGRSNIAHLTQFVLILSRRGVHPEKIRELCGEGGVGIPRRGCHRFPLFPPERGGKRNRGENERGQMGR